MAADYRNETRKGNQEMRDVSVSPVLTAVRDHHSRICEMWREAVRGIPSEEWASGSVDYLVPARHLVHVLVTNDFYSGDTEPGDYDWNGLFGGDWEGMEPDQLPSQERSLRMIDEIEDRVDGRLAILCDDDLRVPQTRTPWAGPTKMHQMLHWLRNFQHHLGELHAELRRRGIPRAGWRQLSERSRIRSRS